VKWVRNRAPSILFGNHHLSILMVRKMVLNSTSKRKKIIEAPLVFCTFRKYILNRRISVIEMMAAARQNWRYKKMNLSIHITFITILYSEKIVISLITFFLEIIYFFYFCKWYRYITNYHNHLHYFIFRTVRYKFLRNIPCTLCNQL